MVSDRPGLHRRPCRRRTWVLGRAGSEPERLTREVLSIRRAPTQYHPDAKATSIAHSTGPPDTELTSVCAGQPWCGAPRRNRTGDPILTMEPPGTAVRTAVSPAHARPSGPRLSVVFRRSYAFSFGHVLNGSGASHTLPVEITSPGNLPRNPGIYVHVRPSHHAPPWRLREHGSRYSQRAASSGLLKGFRRSDGAEFAELPWVDSRASAKCRSVGFMSL